MSSINEAVGSSQMYIDLLKKVLIDYPRIQYDEYKTLRSFTPNWRINLLIKLDNLFRTRNFAICKRVEPVEEDRIVGKDWPIYADTMIGLKRLDNIDYCLIFSNQSWCRRRWANLFQRCGLLRRVRPVCRWQNCAF